MSVGVSLTRSLVRVAVGGESVVHLEPAKHISADVTSRGVTGEQGGTEQENERGRERERERMRGKEGRKEGRLNGGRGMQRGSGEVG